MNPVMYLISDPALGMTKGKFGAQAAHAAVEAFQISDVEMVKEWYVGGHHTKVVLQTDDLIATEKYLLDRGFAVKLIIDEGRTEFGKNLTPTFIGCEIVDKDDPHTASTFQAFKVYKDPKPPAQKGKVIDFKEAKKRLGR